MRKIILFIHSTLNGVVTGDPREDKTNFMVWTSDASMKTGSECLVKTMETVDTVLLGRATYEDLSRKWPFVAEWPGVDDLALRLGAQVNNAAKLVVTRSRDALRWGKFAAPEPVTGDDPIAEVAKLKERAGGDIIIFGSPTLVRSLADAGLIDEYQLQLHPVVVRAGEHLFDDIARRHDFRYVTSKPLDDGSLLVTYAGA